MNNILEGYTYKRCDQYSKEEFINMFQSGDMRRIVIEYVENNPKDVYNTDDEIAVHQIHDGLVVKSLNDVAHRNTTKQYHHGSH